MGCVCHDYQERLLSLDDVLILFFKALKRKNPLSLTRFSHAEITYLSWKINPKLLEIMEEFKHYNGVTGPVAETAKKILLSMGRSDINGFVPKDCPDHGEFWYENTKRFLHHYGKMPSRICSVWVTHDMANDQRFWDILTGVRVALIGRRAKEAVKHFQNKGVVVSHTLNLEGTQQVKQVFKYLKNTLSWDVALISAGIPATILTPQLAADTGRVAIDFGHALDRIIDGEKFDFGALVEKWEKGELGKS